MNKPAPVTDWVHDFDHTDPRWTENPYPIWDELRAECPVVHTNRFLGVYLPTTYEAVKGLGVPNHQRSEVFAALTPGVKDRLKELREEFEKRIPQDIEKWKEAIAAWSALDADTLNAQWQQFDLWSQCLLGIGNWAERIDKSGLFELAASVYAQALELASEKSEVFGDLEVANAGLDITNSEPKQLNLLPDAQPPSKHQSRFSPKSEDWF